MTSIFVANFLDFFFYRPVAMTLSFFMIFFAALQLFIYDYH